MTIAFFLYSAVAVISGGIAFQAGKSIGYWKARDEREPGDPREVIDKLREALGPFAAHGKIDPHWADSDRQSVSLSCGSYRRAAQAYYETRPAGEVKS